jgi:putative DNA primase/helicase
MKKDHQQTPPQHTETSSVNARLTDAHSSELSASAIDQRIAALNFESVDGEEAAEALLYSEGIERLNAGSIPSSLKRYRDLSTGWWCAGVDINTGKPMNWGCFKPDQPHIDTQKNKPIKYEHPPKESTEYFALRVPFAAGLKIAQRYGLESQYTERQGVQSADTEDQDFWIWAIEQKGQIPLVLTEGAKKSACLLSHGYLAVALPGIWGAYRKSENFEDDPTLIAGLRAVIPERVVIFVFDQDDKPQTKAMVTSAVKFTTQVCLNAGATACYRVNWDLKDYPHKGVDDLIAAHGMEAFDQLMKQRQSLGDEESQQSNKPYFTSSIAGGLFRHEPDGEGGWKKPRRIGNHIQAIARVNNTEGNGAALHLEFMSYEDHLRRWTMPRSLIMADSAVLVTELYGMGYYIEDDKKKYLLQYFNNIGAEVEKKYTITDSTGWVGGSFVTQTKTYGDTNLRFKDVERVTDTTCKVAGTLEGWMALVAAMCGGNSRLIFAIGAAFAPPLLEPLGIEGGGFHFFHPTSAGKTTTLMAAASVVGIKNIPRWNMTKNGAEAKALAHDNMLLPLDEINEADEREVGKIAYMLANGEGRARMNRNTTSRKTNSWQLLFISSGEVGIARYIQQAGIQVKGGQEVRMPDIPAVPSGSTNGVFECIHGCHDSKQFAQALERGTVENHGTAIDAFLTRLVAELADENVKSGLRKKVFLVADKLTGLITNHAIRRVANRFALVQVALGLAHSYGLLPFPVEQIDWAVSTMFQDWLETRGGEGSIEVKQAFQRIEHLLVTNEFSDRIYDLRGSTSQPVRNLLAYKKVGNDGQIEEFWIPRSVFKNEFCVGVNQSELIKELQKMEWLLAPRSDGKPVHQRAVSGENNYYYIFRKWEIAGEGGEGREGKA